MKIHSILEIDCFDHPTSQVMRMLCNRNSPNNMNNGIARIILTTPSKHKTMLHRAIYLWHHYINLKFANRCDVGNFPITVTDQLYSCIQPIIIVGPTILVHDFVPSFRAPKVHFELPSIFVIARCSRHKRIDHSWSHYNYGTINESLISGSPCNEMVEHFGKSYMWTCCLKKSGEFFSGELAKNLENFVGLRYIKNVGK